MSRPKAKAARRFERDESLPDVSPGDFVAFKDWAPSVVRMTPITLYKVGWPNKFRVVDAIKIHGVPALLLDPCCEWMENHDNHVPLCCGHPAKYFTKLEEEPAEGAAAEAEGGSREPRPGDRYMSLDIPWGKVVSVEYLDDEKKPVVNIRFGGGLRPLTLSGALARIVRDMAKEHNVL